MLTTKIPAYQTIKNTILTNIHTGVWQVGSAIPAEMALAKQFNVSRMTVNRALKELENERILERRQGSGTFVAQQKYNHAFIEIRNIAKDIIENQQHYHAKVLLQTTINHQALDTLDNLWLKNLFFGDQPTKNAQLYHVIIVHYADQMPMQYEERWVNAHIITSFIEQDFTKVNTSDYLISQVPLESGKYCLHACIAPNDIKNALQMQTHEPALLHTRQTYNQNGMVTFVKMWHAGHRHQFCGQL